MLTNKVLAEAYAANLAAAGKVLTPADQVQVTGGASTDFGNVSFTVPGIHPVFQITSTASEHTRDFAAAARTCRIHYTHILLGCALDRPESRSIVRVNTRTTKMHTLEIAVKI